jgi:C1A family cysteine protease
MFKQSVVVALALLAGTTAVEVSQELAEWSLREHFGMFEKKFEKVYNSIEEREAKFMVFVDNLEDVLIKNAALRESGKDEIHGVTKFSDMSKSEFSEKMLTFRVSQVNTTGVPVAVPTKAATDTSFDWRDSNMVTAVKNQVSINQSPRERTNQPPSPRPASCTRNPVTLCSLSCDLS